MDRGLANGNKVRALNIGGVTLGSVGTDGGDSERNTLATLTSVEVGLAVAVV